MRVRLGDVATIEARLVDPREHMYAALPLINGENIESGTTRLLFRRTAADSGAISSKYEVAAGDVVYSKLRPYLRKVVVADEPGLCSADVYPIRLNSRVADPQWIAWMLVSDDFTTFAIEASARARMPKLNRAQLFSYEFELPPIAQQRHIAAGLDLQLASVERASSRTSQMRAETQVLRARATEESFAGLGQSHREPLGQLGFLEDGDWILTNDYVSRGVRLFQVGDIGRGELLAKSNRFISMNRATELRCTILRAGDILISRMPDPIGRACEIPQLPYPSITAVDVTIFRPDTTRLDTEFVVQFMNSRSWLADSATKASGATRQRISRANMELLEVPVPPLAVQHRIAATLRERLLAIDAVESAVRAEKEAIDALPAALLRRAFDGLAA
jgi:type I restriction enzyme S subunit